jgi:predicted secreted hydrolase
MFSQIMITDVANQIHYQKTAGALYDSNYAESDPSKAWYAKYAGENGGDGAISMHSPADDVYSIALKASIKDTATATPVKIDLQLHQEGPPLLVFGTGVREGVNPSGKNPFERNNYYYSFTRLQASGTIQIGTETFDVQGVTWMDHEYGAFPASTKWFLQDTQLKEKNVQLSNFVADFTHLPEEGVPMAALVTVLGPDGTSTFIQNSTVTPLGPTWKGAAGTTYFLGAKVEIPEFNAVLEFTSSMPDQEFSDGPLYEGVATVKGTFEGVPVTGTGWLEQDY